jgi:hypothetical protein
MIGVMVPSEVLMAYQCQAMTHLSLDVDQKFGSLT